MKPNVIWLTIDSIRADHTSVNGYDRETTPALRSVAESETGANFGNCYAHGIWSMESAASIISGLYPSSHRTGSEAQSLDDSLYTIPERFSDAGYRTVGISANPWFSSDFGMGQGFDVFEKSNKRNATSAGYLNVLRYLLKIRTEGGGLTRRRNAHKSEYISKKTISKHLERAANTERPLFLYAHTEGVHTPYFPPRRTLGEFSDHLDVTPETARERSYEINENLYTHVANGNDLSEEDMEILKTMYDELLRYVDSQVRDVLETIETADIGPTVVVLTSDHGDLFGEKDLLYHLLTVDDALAHVPCVVDGLQHLDLDESVTEGVVQHIDVMKTVLEAVGGDSDDIQGYDLSSEPRDEAVIQRSEAFYEKNVEKLRNAVNEVTLDLEQFLPGFTTALRSESFKFVTNDDQSRLCSLPDEGTDVQSQEPTTFATFEERYDELQDEAFREGIGEIRGGEVSREIEERLQELGYK
jgi:uncharacterized sulfatase